MNKRIKIKDIPFDCVTRPEALHIILSYLKTDRQHFVTTPNPEFIVESTKNPAFKKVLQKADLSVADGTGILWAATYFERQARSHKLKAKNKKLPTTDYQLQTNNSKLSTLNSFFLVFTTLLQTLFFPKTIKKILPERVCGSDLFVDLCLQSKSKIFLLGAGTGVAKQTAKILKKKNPQIQIVGTYAGSPAPEAEEEIIKLINQSQAELLFVAYGSPKQELWINRNLSKLKTVKVAMGIGGSFDFVAGTQKRAPLPFRKLGLEWFYRLMREPKRFKRIWNATGVFIKTILKK